MDKLIQIASEFDIKGTIKEIKPLGNGLINDTYKVTTTTGDTDYVLQRINNSIFTDVDLLQHNIEAVTSHIRKKLEVAGEKDIERKVLRFIPVKGSSKTYIEKSGEFWRVSVFIPDALTFETVDPKFSEHAGRAFGNFESMLSDINEKLGDTIPDFHNMELRARQLQDAVNENKAGRLNDPEVKSILEDIFLYKDEMCKAERLFREGLLPKRICHCDTKVNNMMFDKSGNVLCVIDLDTVMPNYVFSDYGDFLRTAANTQPEDSPNIEQIDFRIDIFKAFTKGYIEGTRAFLTPIERENLPFAACLFPFMQAVRFFTDYLNGDKYYKIKYPEHNLVRTRNQLTLFHKAMSKKTLMKEYIDKL